MTNSISHSGEAVRGAAVHPVHYDSAAWFDSETLPGVRFAVARMSFGRRMELVRRLREIGRKAEFLEAGSDVREKMDGAAMAGEIDRTYLEWGLAEIANAVIDGEAATVEGLIAKGPVALAMEILAKVKAECGLSEDERKN